jgi:hypothetical protein
LTAVVAGLAERRVVGIKPVTLGIEALCGQNLHIRGNIRALLLRVYSQ